MKRIVVILFVVGLLFEFGAFFVDQARNIPLVMKLIAPKYTQAQKGIQTLSAKKTLEPTDQGFSPISEVLLAKLRAENDPKQLDNISVQKFSRGNARLGFSTSRAREVIPINVLLSNGQTLEWNLASLTAQVDTLRSKNLFGVAAVVFLLGVAIQCAAFIILYRESKRPKTIAEL